MTELDANLTKLRLPAQVLQLLEKHDVHQFSALVDCEQLLEEVRKYLNPIQHSKLNALIKEWDILDDDSVEYNGVEILVNREKSASREEIVQQLTVERQCLEELNSIIVGDETMIKMSEGAKQIIQKSKAAHQARAMRLNTILRTKPHQDHVTSDQLTLPKTKTQGTKQVKFHIVDLSSSGKWTTIYSPSVMFHAHFVTIIVKSGDRKKTQKNSLYNSPRAKEGVRIPQGINYIAGAFSTAKDICSVFLFGESSNGSSARLENESATSHHHTRSSSNPDKRMKLESPRVHESAGDSGDSKMDVEDSGYVSVPSADFIRMQQQVYQWRMSLLHRLAGVCERTCKYNRNMERLQNWNRQWIHNNSIHNLQMMSPFVHIPKHECTQMSRAFEAEGKSIRQREGVLKRELGSIRELILEWNRESMRLNLALIENPRLDQSNYLESVVMVNRDGSRLLYIFTQHTGILLVQPESGGPFLCRVQDAQSQG